MVGVCFMPSFQDGIWGKNLRCYGVANSYYPAITSLSVMVDNRANVLRKAF